MIIVRGRGDFYAKHITAEGWFSILSSRLILINPGTSLS